MPPPPILAMSFMRRIHSSMVMVTGSSSADKAFHRSTCILVLLMAFSKSSLRVFYRLPTRHFLRVFFLDQFIHHIRIHALQGRFVQFCFQVLDKMVVDWRVHQEHVVTPFVCCLYKLSCFSASAVYRYTRRPSLSVCAPFTLSPYSSRV
jgi:hypothetical protein